ncbi:MAG: hypothetical protein KAS32_19955 [Candidatus Peribacteraceae bacterium]|nr:hypothetical protein [Candidatus Peribacteraceae bacterium]
MRKIGRIVGGITDKASPSNDFGIYIKEFRLDKAERYMDRDMNGLPGAVGSRGEITLTLFTTDEQELFEVFERLSKICRDYKKLVIRAVE